MALDFPATPTVGQKYPASPIVGVPQYTWDGEKWTTQAGAIAAAYVKIAGDTMTGPLLLNADPSASLGAATKNYVDTRGSGTHGSVRLEYTSPTVITLKPCNGNNIKIGSVTYSLAAALTISNSGLAANTTYYVTAVISGGVPVLNFTAIGSGRVTDPTTGVETITGNPNETIVGMVRTTPTSNFVYSSSQKLVRSFFNERVVSVQNTLVGNVAIGAAGTFQELMSTSRAEFLSWTGETVQFTSSGTWNAGAISMAAMLAVGFEGNQPSLFGVAYPSVAAAGLNAGVQSYGVRSDFTEGHHWGTMMGQAAGGTATYTGGTNGACAFFIQVHGR